MTAIPLADGATLTIQETTEHDLAEREMQRLARLAEIGQMTAAIAHEIRNPLTGIRSAAQMIPLAPEQADEFASIIEVEVTKLSDLCTGFLEFSRPLLLKSSPQRLDGVVRGVVARLQSEFDRAGVQLNLEIAPQAPTIHMDASRIEQVLRNLLLNALEASKRGGRVDVRVDGDGFEVRDDGAGIGEEQKARLFTPFFTTKAQGTGLGLSNVRKIIDAHGAKIDVWSKVGQGTRFRVKFRQEAA